MASTPRPVRFCQDADGAGIVAAKKFFEGDIPMDDLQQSFNRLGHCSGLGIAEEL